MLPNKELQLLEKDHIIGFKKDTPIELNLIQSAMFSKNKNAVKIKEVNLDHLDILIRAVKGHSIPNSFDEDVFFAILHLFVKFKDIWRLTYIPKTIYLTYSDLCSILRLGTQYIDRIRISLDKLASTSYKFTNTFLYRDISCVFVNSNDLSAEEIQNINLTSTIFLCDGNAFNDEIDLTISKIKTIIFVDKQDKLNKLASALNKSVLSINQQLSLILKSKPFPTNATKFETLKEHCQTIFYDYIIAPTQFILEDEEFLSNIRDEVAGNKITDFKVKKNSITSTFNLINFVEYKIEETNISDMLKGAKLTADTFSSVKAFLENKTTSKSKYMLRIDINNYMYENIVNKVYLLHSLDYLLDFTDKTARAIYLYIESSKGFAKKKNKGVIRLSNPNFIIVDAILLAKSVPISVDDKQISSTIKILLRSLDYLKANGYIKEYITHREKPLRNTYFNIEFYAEQNRRHPKFSPYSIKVLPKIVNNNEVISAEKGSPSDIDIPENIKSTINSINYITHENIDSLCVLFRENQSKQVTYKGKILDSSLGELMVKALAMKIKSTKVRSLSGYLYNAINHPEIYAEQLEILKQREYDDLYGVKAKEFLKKNDDKRHLQELEDKLLQTQKDVDARWDLLDDSTKNEYLRQSAVVYKRKKLPEKLMDQLPRHLFAKKELNIIYNPVLRFYTDF